MSERRSALPGARFEGEVTVTEAGLTGMVTLRADIASASIRKVVSAVSGVSFPDQGCAVMEGERGVLWLAPDEVMLIVPHAEAESAVSDLTKKLESADHLTVNVSDARAVFRIEGAGAREMIGKLSPADMRPAAFAPGTLRRTRLAQVPAAIWMTEEGTVHLVCFRSVAGYVFDLLSTAAQPGTLPEHFST